MNLSGKIALVTGASRGLVKQLQKNLLLVAQQSLEQRQQKMVLRLLANT